jgi:hypothetical protein
LGTLSAEKQVLPQRLPRPTAEQIAARLAKALKVDRLIGGTGLPHDDILRALRAAIAPIAPASAHADAAALFLPAVRRFAVSPERKIKQKEGSRALN